jgi:uncharacterized membrane protein YedE/YeeE
MTEYWPSWLVALSLGALTLVHWLVLRRPLGVSGVVARFSRIREEAAYDRGIAVVASDRAALEAAFAAATAEAFGELPTAADGGTPSAVAEEPPRGRVCAPTPRLSAHAIFLLSIVAGGLVAALLRGTFGAPLGSAFAEHFGTGAARLAAIGGGGVLVGFGAALAGGCTSGHGLAGCARLWPASLVATATFFASAVGVSFLLQGLS